MTRAGTEGGMVVVLEGNVAPSLRRIAKKWSFTILEAEAAYQVFEQIRRVRPAVVLVQVGEEGREAMKLIRLVATCAPRIPLLAAAAHHTITVERSAYSAGAKYYIPNLELASVAPVLEALLANGTGRMKNRFDRETDF